MFYSYFFTALSVNLVSLAIQPSFGDGHFGSGELSDAEIFYKRAEECRIHVQDNLKYIRTYVDQNHDDIIIRTDDNRQLIDALTLRVSTNEVDIKAHYRELVASDESIHSRIDSEVVELNSRMDQIEVDISAHVRELVETDDSIMSRIDSEVAGLVEADGKIQSRIDSEVLELNSRMDRIVGSSNSLVGSEFGRLQSIVEEEVSALEKKADEDRAAIAERITNMAQDLTHYDSVLDNRITSEVKTLDSRIDGEVKSRIDSLNSRIAAENTRINNRITTEVHELNNRMDLMDVLNEDIKDVEGKTKGLSTLVSSEVKKLDERIDNEIYEMDNRIRSDVATLESNIDGKVKILNSYIGSEVEKLTDKVDDVGGALNRKIGAEVIKLEIKVNESVKTLNGRIDQSVKTLNGRIDHEENRLDGRISSVKNDLQGKIDKVGLEIEELSEADDEIRRDLESKVEELSEADDEIRSDLESKIESSVETINERIDYEENKLDGRISWVKNNLQGKIDVAEADLKDLEADVKRYVSDLDGKIKKYADESGKQIDTVKTDMTSEIEDLMKENLYLKDIVNKHVLKQNTCKSQIEGKKYMLAGKIPVICREHAGKMWVEFSPNQKAADVNGIEADGGFSQQYTYADFGFEHNWNAWESLNALIDDYDYCEQYVKYSCEGSEFLRWSKNGGELHKGWWTDARGNPRYYWGGNTNGKGCECARTGTCPPAFKESLAMCNCNVNDGGVKRFDDGVLADKTHLPVRKVNAGDTGSDDERARIEIGPLRCRNFDSRPTSCEDAFKNHGISSGAPITLIIDGIEYEVICKLGRKNEVYTVLRHGYANTEQFKVHGFEGPRSFARGYKYGKKGLRNGNGHTAFERKKFTDNFSWCRQFVRNQCNGAVFVGKKRYNYATFSDANNKQQLYWGGNGYGDGCACQTTGTCLGDRARGTCEWSGPNAGVFLSGRAANDATKYGSLAEAKARCEKIGDGCSGVTKSGSEESYTVRSGGSFARSPSKEISYKKGRCSWLPAGNEFDGIPKNCKCNVNDDKKQFVDEGWLTSRITDLPVTQLNLGDTGGSTEWAKLEVGFLECSNQAGSCENAVKAGIVEIGDEYFIEEYGVTVTCVEENGKIWEVISPDEGVKSYSVKAGDRIDISFSKAGSEQAYSSWLSDRDECKQVVEYDCASPVRYTNVGSKSHPVNLRQFCEHTSGKTHTITDPRDMPVRIFEAPRWDPIVKNEGGTCWTDCGKKGGVCPTRCGADGACCREGWDLNSEACGKGKLGCKGSHCCTTSALPPPLLKMKAGKVMCRGQTGKCDLTEDYDFYGNDLRVDGKMVVKVMSSEKECCDWCHEHADCTHWTWIKPGDKSCYLKSSGGGKRYRKGYISGKVARPRAKWEKIVGIKDVTKTLFPVSARDTMMVNPYNPEAEIFMNIGKFNFDDTRYISKGKYTFKLVYGGINFLDGALNEVVFRQSSKPTETTIEGYEWVSGIADRQKDPNTRLRGAAKATKNHACLIDGDGDENGNWWNCMAPTQMHTHGKLKGIPAINLRIAKSAALYILNHRA